MIEEELKNVLKNAAEYFSNREYSIWEKEALDAIECINKEDFSFVEKLWLKYAPTCEIDDLIITNYDPDEEEKVNELNAQLAEIANTVFNVLDKYKDKNG